MESSIKAAEQVQMYYGGETSSSTTESGDSSESTSDSTSANYDMKLVTADGNSYEIYSVNFGDMEKASLMLDDSTVFCIPALYEPFHKERNRYKRKFSGDE